MLDAITLGILQSYKLLPQQISPFLLAPTLVCVGLSGTEGAG